MKFIKKNWIVVLILTVSIIHLIIAGPELQVMINVVFWSGAFLLVLYNASKDKKVDN